LAELNPQIQRGGARAPGWVGKVRGYLLHRVEYESEVPEYVRTDCSRVRKQSAVSLADKEGLLATDKALIVYVGNMVNGIEERVKSEQCAVQSRV